MAGEREIVPGFKVVAEGCMAGAGDGARVWEGWGLTACIQPTLVPVKPRRPKIRVQVFVRHPLGPCGQKRCHEDEGFSDRNSLPLYSQ